MFPATGPGAGARLTFKTISNQKIDFSHILVYHLVTVKPLGFALTHFHTSIDCTAYTTGVGHLSCRRGHQGAN